ncbi:cytidine deaminase-like protein [Gloeophyllum trabeum ATCC 11539]|uniref:Cytosine deaminase n=1 Tax=Gloeophyllum trabeum (strain ATCC 11539 / FP-39264 / Madison 617) TaxID=670483 RepID=S7QP44_GLOTA|nr:cytidine deaminase-like protein [Gloeophyllum trabeum ATCC 11539]EPQ61341.1 cytidine deaminase-like protein [Gloeophyllum trabeum ATCC 11539]
MAILSDMDAFGVRVAYQQAKKSYDEGGIPIGSCIVHTTSRGVEVLGQGHNSRVQKSSATLHGEISALEDAGRLKAEVYRGATIYTTLSPCIMCTGAILLYKIPRVVIAENRNFVGGEELLRKNGVEVVVLDDDQCKELMGRFIKERPNIWYEDIGENVPNA